MAVAGTRVAVDAARVAVDGRGVAVGGRGVGVGGLGVAVGVTGVAVGGSAVAVAGSVAAAADRSATVGSGVAVGVIVSGSRLVTDEMFSTAANALAHEVSEKDLAQGRVYPPLSKVRDVSAIIATAVARLAYDRGLARLPKPDDLVANVRARMFDPVYADYVE